jgi:hypothetical protein
LILLYSGFAARYLLGRKQLSFYLLLCVPLIDLLLLLFVVFDLNNGVNATFAHGLASAYIGFTVAFGSSLISWSDKWFAYKFSDGPRPSSEARNGWALVLEDLKLWFRCLGAVGIIYVLLLLIINFVGDPSKTEALQIWLKIPFFTVLFWFVFGPLWSLLLWCQPLKTIHFQHIDRVMFYAFFYPMR